MASFYEKLKLVKTPKQSDSFMFQYGVRLAVFWNRLVDIKMFAGKMSQPSILAYYPGRIISPIGRLISPQKRYTKSLIKSYGFLFTTI